MKYRFKDGDLWVLVEVYISGCGFVAHWFSYSGRHSFEPFTPVFKARSVRSA